MFCADNDKKKEIFVAELSKVETKVLDYEYLINLMKGRKKCNDLQLVGKMNVSTILTLCHHDNFTMMETQFVLFGDPSTQKNLKKGLIQKLANIFRKFREPNSKVESEINLLEKNVAPNFELAAIVVRERVPFDCVDKVGGWGLKFLNTLRCECYGRENGEDYENCNRHSINVIIPAGIHGGPKSRNDGPSSLIDRWKSGGGCDCGGWDEGCPLTVFQTKSSNSEILSQRDQNCKSLDIVTQDSSNSSIILSMRNIKDGLYYGYFKPPLSALQSFSIALAITHWWNHSLGPITAKKTM
ncbi:unnamed protein product [Lathyrus oleraceus]|uniref:Uncharacterized protein n=1 Tax=Pisum sativum TaxID=3888 RepID=A0A9D5BAJ5_PEA|nr:hypothetical protein KIW84_022910 [Pisum sativum]